MSTLIQNSVVKEPIPRTFRIRPVALTMWRLLQARLAQVWGVGTWWCKPEWNLRKRHASILDLRRLFWRYRAECAQFLVDLEDLEKIPQPPGLSRDLFGRAA
jgi:hypothetical protein